MLHGVVSYPKSGNTWFRLFLMVYLMPPDWELNLNQRPIGFWQDCEPEFWNHLVPEGKTIDELPQHEILTLRPAAFLKMLHDAERYKCIAVVKSHGRNSPIEGIGNVLFPDWMFGPSVYLYRDPRDVFLSFSDHMGQDFPTAFTNMTDHGYGISRPGTGTAPVFVSSWDHNVRSWHRKDIKFPVLRMSYEELRADPEAGFRKGLMHLASGKGEINEERFRRAMEATSLEALKKQEEDLEVAGTPYSARSKHQKRFFREGKIGGWQENLPRDYVKRIERQFGDTMKQLGYELTTRK